MVCIMQKKYSVNKCIRNGGIIFRKSVRSEYTVVSAEVYISKISLTGLDTVALPARN